MTQNGVVTAVDDGTLTLEICQTEACAACNAKGVCSAKSSNKLIKISVSDANNYSIGDRVTVALGRNAGKRAVLYAYVLPVLLLTVTLFLAITAGVSQEVAAIASLGVLALYFAMIYFLKEKIKEKIKFYIVDKK